jgi:hypothetical protein
LQNAATTKVYANFNDGGSSTIHYDGSPKLATTNTGINVTGNIGVTGTVDGIDIAARDAVLTSTTTTAGAALPKAGGTMTGSLLVDAGNNGLDIRLGTDKRVSWTGGIGEIGSTAGFQATNTAGSALAGFGIRASELKFATGSATRLTIDASGDATFSGDIQATGIDLPNANNWSYIKNNTVSGGLRFGTQNAGGTYSDQIEISATGAYVKLNRNTTVTGTVLATANATFNSTSAGGFGYASNNTSFYSFGADTSTAGSYTFQNLSSNASVNITAMKIAADGNVGIGTQSMSSSYGRLTVAGTGISITPDTAAKMQIGRYNSANPYSYIKAGSTSSGFKFTNANDSVDILTIDNTGKVGMGTADPDSKLHVYNGNAGVTTPWPNSAIVVENNGDVGISLSTPDANAGHIMFGSPSHAYNAYIRGGYGASTSSTLKFFTDQIETMTLTAGNVGIGTDSPTKKLTVFGTGAGNATVQIEGEGGADPYINFLANNTQHWSLGIDDSDADKFKLSEHSALGTNDYFVVDVTGNVGIGTTPQSFSKLQVKATTDQHVSIFTNSSGLTIGGLTDNGGSGALRIAGAPLHLTGQGGGAGSGPDIAIISSGNVGIGTDAPGYLLTVKKDVDSFIMKVENDGNSAGTSGASYADASDGLWVDTRWNTSTNTPFKVTSNSGTTPMMIIKGDGKVGIGTNNPANRLHIDYSVSTSAANLAESKSVAAIAYYPLRNSSDYGMYFGNNGTSSGYVQVTNGSSASTMNINPYGGNVGIGTAAPSSKLHVKHGDIRLEGNAESGQDITFTITNDNSGNEVEAGLIRFIDTGGGQSNRGAAIASYMPTADTGDLRFYTSAGADRVERMRIYRDGNVGIGTTGPTAKLEIGPEGSLGANITNKNVIMNVLGGYGTTGTPSSGQYKVIGFTGTTKDVGDITGQTGGEVQKNFYVGMIGFDYFNGNRFSVWQGGSERLTIQGYGAAAGNVGIGTTSPNSKLHVAGTLATGATVITSADASNAFIVKTDHSGNPTAVQIGGSGAINGVSSANQSFTILNVAKDSGSGNSAYFHGNIKTAGNINRGAAEMGTAIIHDHQLGQTTYSLANSNTTWVNSGLTKTVTPQSAKSYFWVEVYHNEHINPNTPNHGGGMRILGDSTEIARGGEFEFQVGTWASSTDYRYNGNSKTWGSWYNPQTASAIVFKAQVVAPNNTGGNTGNYYYWHWGSGYIANNAGPRLRIVEFT